MSHLAARVPPYLRARRVVMCHVVVTVGELVQHFIAPLRHLCLRVVATALDASLGRREDDLGTVGFHSLNSLQSGVLGHDQLDVQVKNACNHGQSNASVAAGGLDQLHAWADLPSFQGLLDHIVGRPVLNRPTWVLPLQLGQDPNIWLVEQRTHLHERCVANQPLNRVGILDASAEGQHLRLVENAGIGQHTAVHSHVAPQHTIVSDYGGTAQHLRPCVNAYPILYIYFVADAGQQGYSGVQDDSLAQADSLSNCQIPDMLKEQPRAYLHARMDADVELVRQQG